MCKTIKQKVKISAAPSEVYEALADSRAHSQVSGAKATISRKVGGPFSALGGRVCGVMVDLAPGKRIVQAWRSKDFPEGIFSMVTIQLKKTANGTELVLTHRGVPKELIPDVEQTWRTRYWPNLKSYLAERG